MPAPSPLFPLTGRLLAGSLSLSGLAVAQTSPSPSVPAPAACALPPGTLPTQTRAVFVLDTSGSMRGIGDGKANIFGKVKERIGEYVAGTQPNRVDLITFDSGVRAQKGFDLPAQAAALRTYLAGLEADGNNTHLYRSLSAALRPLTAGDRYLTSVFVLTDGIDNDPQPEYSADRALAAFEGRGALDTLNYLALGSSIPPSAQSALRASDYASGITLPPGEVPNLADLTGGIRMATVIDAARVPAPFPDGTPLTLAAQESGVSLAGPTAQAGSAALRVPRRVTDGSAALLCAPAPGTPGVIGPRPQRVLLKLRLGADPASVRARGEYVAPGGEGTPPLSPPSTSSTTTTTVQTTPPPAGRGNAPGLAETASALGLLGLTWLNPGADLELGPGEATVLRYRVATGLALDGLQLLLPAGLPGLSGSLERQGDGRELAVRLVRSPDATAARALTAALPGGVIVPRLVLPAGQVINLSAVGLTEEARSTSTPPAPVPASSTAAQTASPTPPAAQPTAQEQNPGGLSTVPWWVWLLLGLGLLAALLAWRRGRRGARRGQGASAAAGAPPASPGKPGSAPSPAAPLPTGRVEGVYYGPDGTLALVDLAGETRILTPPGGPFDLGELARVPELRGLRAEAVAGGLLLGAVPGHLIVSEDTRLIEEGEVLPAGTLLSLAPVEAPGAGLGSLAGLGRPLMLRAEGDEGLTLSGPYGEHLLALKAGETDVGESLGAPALRGLRLVRQNSSLILAQVPGGVALAPSGERLPLRAGTPLPPHTGLLLRGL